MWSKQMSYPYRSLPLPLRIAFLLLVPVLSANSYCEPRTPNQRASPLLPEIAQAIRVIENHPDTFGKIGKLYRFLRSFPADGTACWARGLLHRTLIEAGEWEKAVLVGKQLLDADPMDLEAAENTVEAVRKFKPADVAEWEARVLKMARTIRENGGPAAALARAVKLVEDAESREENDLYRAVVDSSGKPRLEAAATFLERFPQSPHRVPALRLAFEAAQATKDPAAIAEAGERLLTAEPTDDAALLAVAQVYLNQRRNYDKVAAYAQRILGHQAQNADAAPQSFYLGSAHLLLGSLQLNRQNFEESQRHLRLARPHVKDKREAAVLFYLGYTSYYLERYTEAREFFTQCAAIASEYRDQALANLASLDRRTRGQ